MDGGYGTDSYGSGNYGSGSSVVELVDAGNDKLEVIKVVREITGLGLSEAKDLVDSAPSIIKNGVTETEAQNIKAQLETAGASVSIR
ncbi:MAG: ribosomal protein L7/L12 [Lachnospiraceae bacterium]|nr:ribosomal protein L7/L12 [Lachnospiraceae bacterium]